jgi:hypothetical protein
VESGYQIPIFRQTAICFIIVPLLTRVVNYPTFKGKEALPDEVPPSSGTSKRRCLEPAIIDSNGYENGVTEMVTPFLPFGFCGTKSMLAITADNRRPVRQTGFFLSGILPSYRHD